MACLSLLICSERVMSRSFILQCIAVLGYHMFDVDSQYNLPSARLCRPADLDSIFVEISSRYADCLTRNSSSVCLFTPAWVKNNRICNSRAVETAICIQRLSIGCANHISCSQLLHIRNTTSNNRNALERNTQRGSKEEVNILVILKLLLCISILFS